MTDTSPVLSMPFIMPSQAQKHVTHNEALRHLDVIVQAAVIDRDRAAPPATSQIGDRHIVGGGASGAWAGRAGDIALFAADGWQFTTPSGGWRVHVLQEGETLTHDGSVWRAPSESTLLAAQLGIGGAAPDETNRLAVSAPAVLLNHAGADHQLKINKAAPGDTASLLFQTGFSGRAEMGLAGGDDFEVKVSDDGAIFRQAVVAEASTGLARFPQGARTAALEVDGDSLRVTQPRTPGSASDSGAAGQIVWDADYVYVCVATDTWKRAALSSW